MNLNRSIVQEAELKARRFSKGVYCFILNETEHGPIVKNARNAGIIPSLIKKTQEFYMQGWDPTTGYMLLIPISKLTQLKTASDIATNATYGSTSVNQFTRLFNETVILARVSITDNPFGPKYIDGTTLNAVVSGADTAQEVDVKLVPRSIFKTSMQPWNSNATR